MHCFEIRTANIDYYIGEDPLYGQKDAGKISLPTPESGIGAHLAKTWENAIRLHCMAEIMKGRVHVDLFMRDKVSIYRNVSGNHRLVISGNYRVHNIQYSCSHT